MTDLHFNLKHPCIQCGNLTKSLCTTCRRSLCGRCRTRKQKLIPLTSFSIPSGVCNDCHTILLLYPILNLAIEFTNFIYELPEKIEEWKKRYL